MLKLRQSVAVTNPAEFLKKESGVFSVTSPTGDQFRVVCRPGRPLRITEHVRLPEMKRMDLTWRIEKIGRAPEAKKEAS